MSNTSKGNNINKPFLKHDLKNMVLDNTKTKNARQGQDTGYIIA